MTSLLFQTMTEYNDIELVCLCGAPFTWTAGEQKFLNDLVNEGKIASVQQPKRCAPCRQKNREEHKRKREEYEAHQAHRNDDY